MKQNRLTLNEAKMELMVFRNEKLPIIEPVNFKGHRLDASEKGRYVGVIIDRELTYKNQLNKVISKMASAIRSLYLVRYQIPLKTRINLFKSQALSHLDFSSIFFDTARDLLLETKILPAELQITRVSLNRFYSIFSRKQEISLINFSDFYKTCQILEKKTNP